MSLTPIGSDQSQSIGTLLLQQLNAIGSSTTQDASGLSGLLGDLMTLSPAAQQLTKAPEEVTKALSDLLTTQKDVSGDIDKLKTYFKENPKSLATVLGSLQGSSATYDATGANSALLTALMNNQSKNSNPAALLTLLQGSKAPTLFDALNDSGGSDSSLSIFG
ncbi:hypothetical protein [Geothrix sp. PMB-07]|uniref:hypothetical protein n=1 Tax=Geothrix sp. PMB-07 TaxID=3068640 RepID=UPI002740BF2C|nr:hypothetical protein [Geothrix sp. PMB-07]WLT31302.1 hypothetical protein Q9293_16415 [Geothrix sp. PMB-07]